MQAFNDESGNVACRTVNTLRQKIDVALQSTCKPKEEKEEERREGEEEGAFFMVREEEKEDGSEGEEELGCEGKSIASGDCEPNAECKGPNKECYLTQVYRALS